MAPSKKATVTEKEPSLSDVMRFLKSQSEQLATISSQMAKVDKIETEVKDLKTLMVALREENKELKLQVKEKDQVIEDMSKTVAGLEEKLNSVELHHRGWGARVLNIGVTDAEAADPMGMINRVFDLFFSF